MDFVILRYNSDGNIDNTFGTSGIVTANFDNRWDTGYSVAIQSDGKILLAGTAEVTSSNMDFACIRLNTDGTFDNTFGTSGKVNINVYDINDYCYSVLIQTDNKILMGGATSNSFALARLNTDGSIDYSFDSDGKVITTFASNYTEINSMALQNDGKILIAGNGNLWNGFTYTYDFTVARYDNPSVLPVEISSFTVIYKNNLINIYWTTATEINNYGFEIERSVVGKKQTLSENVWEKIGFVAGHGNSNSPKYYSFTDKNPLSGKITYRLKQIDIDGTISYSNEVEISTEVPKVFSLQQNYPNPFNPSTTFEFTIPEDGLTTLKIYDFLGQEIQTLVNEELKSGQIHRVNFDGSRLASGIYFYKLESKNHSAIKKFILMK